MANPYSPCISPRPGRGGDRHLDNNWPVSLSRVRFSGRFFKIADRVYIFMSKRDQQSSTSCQIIPNACK